MSGAAGKFGLSNNYASLFRTAVITAAVNIEIMFSVQYLTVNNPQRKARAAGMDIELDGIR